MKSDLQGADEKLVRAHPKIKVIENALERRNAVRRRTDGGNYLDNANFIKQLNYEQRRVQRSEGKLSILILTHNLAGQKKSSIRALIKKVRAKIRETDILGYIDQNTLGVLLPYTGEEGAKESLKKIMVAFQETPLLITSATYPDHIFESLAKNGCVSPEAFGHLLDDSIDDSEFKFQVKRTIDVIGSIALMLALSPVMIVTAILIKFSSPGPVIFKQTRLGMKGVPIEFYKFRSMHTDTNDQIHRDFITELIKGNHTMVNYGNAEKPIYKIKSDPRITKVGKVIRKTSIDELPQLFNVLKGEMSLVGPRPPLAYEAEKYQPWHLRRILDMKPGITGLWQVEGRSKTGFDDAVRLDIKYIQTWSLSLDLKILLKTVKEVLNSTGAY
jgi:lipopolysaccharide/colanic/teichoic acid biosynthesis glycosyltransferase